MKKLLSSKPAAPALESVISEIVPAKNGNKGNQTTAPIHLARLEELQRRANHPFRGSPEYTRVIAECVVWSEAQRTLQEPAAVIVAIAATPASLVVLLLVLLDLGAVLWATLRILSAL